MQKCGNGFVIQIYECQKQIDCNHLLVSRSGLYSLYPMHPNLTHTHTQTHTHTHTHTHTQRERERERERGRKE